MIYYILFNENISVREAMIMFIIMLFVYLVSITIHEFSHGYVAYKFGDDTAKLAGRLTLNPFKHLTVTGFLFFILFGVGWANPVPINPLKFKKYRTGSRWVSMAGIIANFVLGLLAAILYAILYAAVGVPNLFMEYIYIVLQYTMLINSALVLFNILPIYPLDGFNFVSTFLHPDSKFITNGVRNGFKILWGIILGCMLFELFFNIDILTLYLSIIYDLIYCPITWLGLL